MRYFLIVYNRAAETLVNRFEFTVEERAMALEKRRSLQLLYRDDPETEVVLLGAQRFEDLEKTHGRYFKKAQLPQMAETS